MLESLYALLGVLVVLAAYGAWAAWRYRRSLLRWLSPLALAAVLVVGHAIVVLRPYLLTRATWDVLARTGTTFMSLENFTPGHGGFPGWILLALVAVALADRVRRRRETDGQDPRLALLFASLLVLWCAMRTLTVLGVEVPSPLLLLWQIVPGTDAVRVLGSVGRVVVLPSALLAGYGVLALIERRGVLAAVSIASVFAMLVVAERWVPAVARATFGRPLDLAAFAARPPEADIELLRTQARGALLDLPHAGGALGSGSYLMLDAFRPGPVAACYNSFASPLDAQMSALALALPRASAVDALVALGFETLLLHADRMEAKRVRFFTDLIAVDPAIGERLQLVGRTQRLLVFRMISPAPVASDPAVLVAAAPDADTRSVEPGHRTLELGFANPTDGTYAQRPPIVPLAIEARWRDADGAVVHAERTRAVLPIVLGPGATARVPITLDVPARAGNYDLTIGLASAPDVPLAWTRVSVAAPAS